MRIVFVTGCLEPSRDGVGDYVRTLAAECVQRGHKVALVSLAEHRVIAPGAVEHEALPMLRLTLEQAAAGDGVAVRQWVEAFRPDWTSLHFVPYSFHPRGFFGGRISLLAKVLGAAAHRHVFFHELWIGSAVGAAVKERATGWWQRRGVGELLRRIMPEVIHTSIGYYRAALATIGYQAGLLPMFGSVPAGEGTAARIDLPGIESTALVCGMFGALHPNWVSEPFLSDFAALGTALGRPPVLAAAGAQRHGQAIFARLAAEWRGRVACVALGEQSAAQLTRVFARFDFAVATSPWNLIGKSSSAAALREHGLSVVVTNAGTAPRFAVSAADLEPADGGFLPYFRDRAQLATVPGKTSRRHGVKVAAELLLADLQRANVATVGCAGSVEAR